MRIGQNPLRIASVSEKIKPVACIVVTHLPSRQGYHEHRLEVIQTCLTTMRERARVDHTFIVWDNGSCPELLNWLVKFAPDMLMLSKNIGKTAARTSLIRMLPPKTIVCYSDDDILFYDNWLRPQIEILEGFPNVACVTGYPVRTASRWGVENTLAWAQKNGKLERGKFIPREWENDFCISIGRNPKEHVHTSQYDEEGRVTYNGRQAYCLSHHCQFIGYQERLAQAAVYDGKAMGDEKVLDIALDKIGLRLATTQRYARHIGNVMDEKARRESA